MFCLYPRKISPFFEPKPRCSKKMKHVPSMQNAYQQSLRKLMDSHR